MVHAVCKAPIIAAAVLAAAAMSCKSRPPESGSELLDAAPPSRLIKVDIECEDQKTETLYLGLEQPGGGLDTQSLAKFQQDNDRLARCVQLMLLSRTVPANFVQQLDQEARGGNSSRQLARHMLPKELIPAVLWNRNIRWDYFIWPLPKFAPDEVRRLYAQLSPQERLDKARELPLLDADPVTFTRLVAYYERTYNLPVFKTIRREVTKDQLYEESAAGIQTSFNMVMSGVMMIFTPRVDTLWKSFFSGAGFWTTKARAFATLASTVLPYEYVKNRYKDTVLHDQTYLEEARDVRALMISGKFGPQDLQANRQALADLKAKTDVIPAIARFLATDFISETLLDPMNCFDLTTLAQAVGALDKSRLQALKQSDPDAIKSVVDALNDPQNTDDDKRFFAEVVAEGSKSGLFAELLLIGAGQNKRVAFVDAVGGKLGSTDAAGAIKLARSGGLIKFQSSRARAFAYYLGHELWHSALKFWAFNQLMDFASVREFAAAIAGSETMAFLVQVAIRQELHDATLGALNLENLVEQFNPLSLETLLSLDQAVAGADGIEQVTYPLVMKTYQGFFDSWHN